MKVFSQSQRDRLADAIVSVMWTKKAVLGFLYECNVPSSMIQRTESFGMDSVTKRRILDVVFSELIRQYDKGTPQFMLMADRLCNWTDFDPKWFGPNGNLDEATALHAINALRRSIGMQEHTRTSSNDNKPKQPVSMSPKMSINELKHDYEQLTNQHTGLLTPQKRGYEFENLLNRLFKASDIQAEGPFRANELQIDGAFKYDNHHYILEAKWSHASESAEPLLYFAQKAGMNMDGRGLFISINGFTIPSIKALVMSKVKDVILMDGQDLYAILDERITLTECLEEKIRAAQTRGTLYFDSVTRQSKAKLELEL